MPARAAERRLNRAAIAGEPCQTLDAAALKPVTGAASCDRGAFMTGAALIQPADFVRAIAASSGDPQAIDVVVSR